MEKEKLNETQIKEILGLKETSDQKDKHGREIYITKLTPDAAERILQSNNNNNRKISKETVNQYSSEMAKDEWILSDSIIIFGKNGEMENGQHRCYACVKSRRSFYTVVGFGWGNEDMILLDRGRRRTLKHNLQVIRNEQLADMGKYISKLLKVFRNIKNDNPEDVRKEYEENKKHYDTVYDHIKDLDVHFRWQYCVSTFMYAMLINPDVTLKKIENYNKKELGSWLKQRKENHGRSNSRVIILATIKYILDEPLPEQTGLDNNLIREEYAKCFEKLKTNKIEKVAA